MYVFYFPNVFISKKRCTNVHPKTIVTVKMTQTDYIFVAIALR